MLTPQCSDPGTLSTSSTKQRFRGTLGLSCPSAHLTLASFRRLGSSTLPTWEKAPTMLKLPICGQDTVLAAQLTRTTGGEVSHMPMRDLYWSRSLWPSTLQHISPVYLPFAGSPWPSRARRQTRGERSQGNSQSASGAPRDGAARKAGGSD